MDQNKEYICFPPPNVTGKLHAGHFLVYIIIDFIAKVRSIMFYKPTEILPGYDHGGIATYVTAKKLNSKNEDDTSSMASYHQTLISNQLQSWHGEFNWKYKTYTLDEDYRLFVQQTFIKLYEKGLIYRSNSMVNWDTKLQTAISDLEIDFINKPGFLYDIQYKLDNGTYLTVSTTRPETILADSALMIHPDDDRYTHLIGQYATIPLINRRIPILQDKYVDMKFGTGVLKVTPAHDPKDFLLGEKHNLPMINLFDDNLEINSDHIDLPKDRSVKNIRLWIVKKLQCSFKTITHKIPISTRSKGSIEYCLKNQWFMNMKLSAQTLIQLIESEDLRIWPMNHFQDNLIRWLENIRPWCLSRSIPWGHKIPIWWNNDQYKVSLISPGDNWVQTTDRLDTWFSSALWTIFFQHKFKEIDHIPVLCTGADIIFFWVARMCMMSLILYNKLPFTNIFLNGLVRDSKGNKMSKTKGNVIDPQDIITDHSYDITRLSLLTQLNPNEYIKISELAFKKSKQQLQKLKNLDRFIHQLEVNNKKISILPANISIYIEEYTNYMCTRLEQYIKDDYFIHKSIGLWHEWLYYMCDWFVELSKIDNSLTPSLLLCYKRFLQFSKSIVPVTASNYDQNININISKYKVIQQVEEPIMIKVIRAIRGYNSYGITYYTDNKIYHDVIKFLCKSHYNIDITTNTSISIHGVKFYIHIHNINRIYEKITKLKDTITTLRNNINSYLPSDIIEKRKKNLHSYELQVLSIQQIILLFEK